jgi:hypothetical protein
MILGSNTKNGARNNKNILEAAQNGNRSKSVPLKFWGLKFEALFDQGYLEIYLSKFITYLYYIWIVVGHNILEPTTGFTFFNSGFKNDPTKLSIIQWIMIFGKVSAELACDDHFTRVPCLFYMGMSRSII